MLQHFGIIGLAVMGENIALNIERNGFPIAVYNRTYDKTESFVQKRAQGKRVVAAKTLKDFVASLERPRRILVMVKAGKPVDAVIDEIKPLLEEGDILIDGGNSHYPDTDRRATALAPTGIKFFGMGVSGGEEGALWGPSLMPGGDRSTYHALEPVLTKIAAKADGEACVTYIGTKSSGHFVKMVHNGIEYGDMQLIAETYDVMRHLLRLSPSEIADIFTSWNQGELLSYLIEITSHIVNFPDDQGEGVLIDKILDSAGQKGTGKWTTYAALDLGVAIPTITAAVDARITSSYKSLRQRASQAYPHPIPPFQGDKAALLSDLRAALYTSKISSYAQGFMMLQEASKAYDYQLNLGEIARIWKGGCIIRAAFLDTVRSAFAKQPDLPLLLLDSVFQEAVASRIGAWRRTVSTAIHAGIAVPAMSASLAWFDAICRERLPADLIQAQRDFFGAHTYQRIDREGTFHTQWPLLITPDAS